MAAVDILGIDFTSRPSRRKPITCLRGTFDGGVLRARSLEEWPDYSGFEGALARAGPWVAGLDFPFGQSLRFIETIGWPRSWSGYVAHAESLGRVGFRAALTRYRDARPPGDKEHRRAADVLAGSISPQKLNGVPVALMFFEGAPRLAAAGVTIPHLQDGDPDRIAVEAYPGVLARTLIGRRSYKTDMRGKQTADQHEARREILRILLDRSPELYGLTIEIEMDLDLCDDPSADHLDALLCAVQAAWAWGRLEGGRLSPKSLTSLEGWIADPACVGSSSQHPIG